VQQHDIMTLIYTQ